MNAIFTLSTAEQPATHEWADAMPNASVYAPDWGECSRTLRVWTDTTFERAIDYLDLFEPVDDLAPPQPFDPREQSDGIEQPFLCGLFRFVAGYDPVTGWQCKDDDGLNILSA